METDIGKEKETENNRRRNSESVNGIGNGIDSGISRGRRNIKGSNKGKVKHGTDRKSEAGVGTNGGTKNSCVTKLSKEQIQKILTDNEGYCWWLADFISPNADKHLREDLAAEARYYMVYSLRTYDPSKGSLIKYIGNTIKYKVHRHYTEIVSKGIHLPTGLHYKANNIVPKHYHISHLNTLNSTIIGNDGEEYIDKWQSKQLEDRKKDETPEFPSYFWPSIKSILPKREYAVICDIYKKGAVLQDIGKKLGVSYVRIQQLRDSALMKIRKNFTEDYLRDEIV